jgi:hypothetical protein
MRDSVACTTQPALSVPYGGDPSAERLWPPAWPNRDDLNESIKALATLRDSAVGVPAAETFTVLREVIR